MGQGDVYVSYKEKLNKPMITFFKGAGLDGKPVTKQWMALFLIDGKKIREEKRTGMQGYMILAKPLWPIRTLTK